MEKIGVEAVVEGLVGFVSALQVMDNGLSKLEPKGTLLQRTFSFLSDTISSFGREILNVAEYAMGKILADSIQFVVQKIRELVTATIEAGQEFQVLSIRLDRLNFNELTASGKSFNEAMAESVKMTQQQLSWLQKLAAQTPYDNQDIANVYTLARSYGYAANAAQGLTEDIINFASGMGLGSQEMERIIVNFGQMTQQGKVTGRELTDLARGAFVPVNKVLQQMQKDTGLTGEAFDKFKNSAAGVEAFMKAFSNVVATEFSGAAEKLARTFEGAKNNAADMIKSIVGLNIVKPILDTIGGTVADFLGEFTKGRTIIKDFGDGMVEVTNTTRWDQLVAAATRIGSAISDIVTEVLGLLPSTEGIADNVVASVEAMADWIEGHKSDIVNFFKGIGTAIQTKVVPFISKIVDGFSEVGRWVKDNKELIGEFFSSVGDIVSGVIENLTGRKIDSKGGLSGFLDLLQSLMKFVIANEDKITTAVTGMVKAFLIFQVVATVIGFVISAIASFVGTLVTIGATAMTVIGFIQMFSGTIGVIGTIITGTVVPAIAAFLAFLGAMIVPILLVIATIALLVLAFNTDFAAIGETIKQLWAIIKFYFSKIMSEAGTALSQLVAISRFYWLQMVDSVRKYLLEILLSIGEWAISTSNSISGWASRSASSISNWVFTTKSQISNWVSNIGGAITKWASDSLAKIRQFANESMTHFSSWGPNAYNHLLASVSSLNWFAIGVQIISRIIDGFTSISLPTINPPSVPGGGGGGGGGGGCFIAGTKVFMADGTEKNIEDIIVGERVKSYDTENNKIVYATVTQTLHHHERPQPYYLLINSELGITPNHPVFTNGRWMEAGSLAHGDSLLNILGHEVAIKSIRRVDQRLVVYNLHTDHDVHNYFANGFLVHNAVSKDARASTAGATAVQSSSSVPMSSIVNSSVVINNEYNLAIHSSANTESVVQDFAMMESMSGG